MRVVGAEIEPEGAVELSDALGGKAVGDELAAEDGGFGVAADAAEIGKVSCGERAVEDGTVGFMALRHAEDGGVGGERVDDGREIGDVVGVEIPSARKSGEPLGAGIVDGNRAAEREEDGEEGLRDVAGAEDDDGPGGAAGGMGLEVEFDGAAAGHADVGFQRPRDEAGCGSGGAGGGEELLGEVDGLGFDAAAADSAGVEAGGCDEHFRARVLGGAAEGFDENDEDERCADGFERGELGVEGGGRVEHCGGGRGGV